MIKHSQIAPPHIANENPWIRRDTRRFTFVNSTSNTFPNGQLFKIIWVETDWYKSRNMIIKDGCVTGYYSEYELENGIILYDR